MKKLNTWAYHHRFAAQAIIFALHFFLIYAAMTLAGSLQAALLHDQALPVFLIAVVALAGGLLLYKWIKRKRLPWHNNVKFYSMRAAFFLIGLGTFLSLIAFYTSNGHLVVNQGSAVYSSFVSRPAPVADKNPARPDYRNYASPNTYYKDLNAYYNSLSKKELKQERRKLLRSGEFRMADGSATIWHVLLILGALLVLYGIAGLACSLSCSGSDALAVVVAALGLAGVIWGTIALWRVINRNRDRKQANAPPPQPDN